MDVMGDDTKKNTHTGWMNLYKQSEIQGQTP